MAIQQYRASRMPMAFLCAGSLQAPLPEEIVPAESVGPEALLGTGVHQVLAGILAEQLWDEPLARAPEIAQNLGIDADELEGLAARGLRCLLELREHFGPGEVMAEAPLQAHVGQRENTVLLQGTLDSFYPRDTVAIVVDYKTGRLDTDCYHQLATYAFLAFEDCNPEKVLGFEVRVRDGNYRRWSWTRKTINEWSERFLNEVVDWDGTYRVGGHCQYCPRATVCEARHAMVRSTITELLAPEGLAQDARGELAPRVHDLYHRVKVVEGAISQFRDWLRTEIETGGPIPGPDETQLALVDKTRSVIDAQKAWAVLMNYLTPDELAPCVKIGKTAMLAAVGEKAPNRQKGKMKAQVMRELEGVEAIGKHSYKELRLVRP